VCGNAGMPTFSLSRPVIGLYRWQPSLGPISFPGTRFPYDCRAHWVGCRDVRQYRRLALDHPHNEPIPLLIVPQHPH
jgi:hypothetical protein